MSDVIERGGRVVGFDGDVAQVRLESASGCGGCGSRGTCGSGSKTPLVIRMRLPAETQIGDRVTVSMPSSSIALAALLGYLLPPACLLAGAIAGAIRYGADAPAVIGAGLGLFVGLLLARLIAHLTFRRGVDPVICGLDSHHGAHS